MKFIYLILFFISAHLEASPGVHQFNILLSNNKFKCNNVTSVASISSSLYRLDTESGSSIPYQITLTPAQACDTKIYLNILGTAVTATDFTGLTNMITIPKGTTTYNGSYNLVDNALVGDKTLSFSLAGTDRKKITLSANYQAQLNIEDNDSALYTGSEFYRKAAEGFNHGCAITALGVLKCWGSGGNGQVGDGAAATRSSPTVVDRGVSYVFAMAAMSYSCGITSAGVLKCWGDNSAGQVGDGTTTQRNSPVVVDSGVSYSMVAGSYHACGVTTAGVLKCWGQNSFGQYGDGTTNSSLTPVVIDGGTNYSTVATGNAHTCAVATSGTLKC